MNRRGLTSRQLLLAYAVSYLSLITLAPNARVVVASVGGSIVVLAVGSVIHQRRPTSRHDPGQRGRLWVVSTSAAQGVAVVAGLVIGHTVSWHLLLPVILTAWAMHLVAIGLTVRRAVDAWSAPVAVITTSGLWLAVIDGARPDVSWPLAGGLAAGVCLTYAHALGRSREEPLVHQHPLGRS